MLPSSRAALRIVVPWLVAAAAWILLTDVLVEFVVVTPRASALAHIANGWLFVGVSAVLLFGFLRHSFRRLASTRAAREASETRFAGLLEVVPQAIVATDDQGRIVFINRNAQAMFGVAAGEVMGRPLTVLLAPSSADAYRRYADGAGAAPAPDALRRRMDLVGRRKDGTEVRIRAWRGRLQRHHLPLYVTFLDVAERGDQAPPPADAAPFPAPPQTIADCMSRQLRTVSPEDDAWAALAIMRGERIRHLLVTEGENLVGLLSNRDYRRILHRVRPDGSIPSVAASVRQIMTRRDELVTVRPRTTLAEAAALIVERGIGCLPVVDDAGRAVGIVTQADLLRAMLGGAGHAGT